MKLRALSLVTLLVLCGCDGMAAKGSLVRADTALQERRFDDAMGHVRNAEMWSSDSPETMVQAEYMKARILEERGDLAGARGVYAHIMAMYPTSNEAYIAKEKLRVK